MRSPQLGGYDLVRLPPLLGFTTHKDTRTNVHAQGQRKTACLGSSKRFHQPGPPEAFCSSRCWKPPGREAAHSAQDLTASPLGVLSKLMLGSHSMMALTVSHLIAEREQEPLSPFEVQG